MVYDFVFLCSCVYVCFCIYAYLVLFFPFFLTVMFFPVCFLKRERKKDMELDAWGSGEVLGVEEEPQTWYEKDGYRMENDHSSLCRSPPPSD